MYNDRATYRTKTYIAGDWTGDSERRNNELTFLGKFNTIRKTS